MTASNSLPRQKQWVKESAFGTWFLNTDTWVNYVLKQALDDLDRMLAPNRGNYPQILDIGCGFGRSIKLLDERFQPQRIVGVDVDPEVTERSKTQVENCRCEVQFLTNNAAKLDLPDESFDMLFCHQTFHHIVDQENAIREFYRVLKPGGVLLFAESCRRFIHSWIIRLLFRHPMDVQKTADEYVSLLRKEGFKISADCISKPNLWWSRADLGILERLGKSAPKDNEDTMVNIVAVRAN